MNINDIDIHCTGCSSCYSSCPHDAIQMNKDYAGFWYPDINTDKCTNCSLCVKKCPVYNHKEGELPYQKCYAVFGEDKVRQQSSSGGMFSYLAEYVFSLDGYVCGAAFDENMQVKHTIANKEEGYEKFRGSKYVESDLNTVFRQIKEILKSGKYCLFSGLPCQVAGLVAYLGKDYENLITTDLLCGSVPSHLVLDKFFEETYPNEKVLSYSFRDKENGWNKIAARVITDKGNYYLHGKDNIVFNCFSIDRVSSKNTCMHCIYRTHYRFSDFTIGDYWGIYERDASLDDDLGTSAVLVNTKKAVKVFDQVKNMLKLYKETPIEYLDNNVITNLNLQYSPARKAFLRDLQKMSLYSNYQEKTNKKYYIGILGGQASNTNFGMVLSSFALSKFLSEYNNGKYYPMHIDYRIQQHSLIGRTEKDTLLNEDSEYFKNGINPKFEKFREKYIERSMHRMFLRGISYVNNIFSIFILGPGRYFNTDLYKEYYASYMQFVNNDKKIISLGVSMGDVYGAYSKEIDKMKEYSLKRFDAVGVRENSSYEYCKSKGINAKKVLDPVFYLNIEEYDKLASDTEVNETYKALCYTASDGFWNALQSYASNIVQDGSVLKNIKRIDYHISIESWLYLIKNCEVIVTNSFYAVCFAIIFKKDFICFSAKETGERIEQLLEDLGIQNRMFRNISNQDYMYIIKSSPIDYDDVYSKLQALKEDSINFLINAIETELHNNEKPYYTQQLLDLYQNTYGGIIDNLETILKIKE